MPIPPRSASRALPASPGLKQERIVGMVRPFSQLWWRLVYAMGAVKKAKNLQQVWGEKKRKNNTHAPPYVRRWTREEGKEWRWRLTARDKTRSKKMRKRLYFHRIRRSFMPLSCCHTCKDHAGAHRDIHSYGGRGFVSAKGVRNVSQQLLRLRDLTANTNAIKTYAEKPQNYNAWLLYRSSHCKH